MTTPSPPEPPPVPAPPATPARLPIHPLATAGVIASCAGFAIPAVAGLVGALLGALALRAIAREPQRWRGVTQGQIALGLGLLTGAVPIGVIFLVQRDDWGPLPLLALIAYAGAVAGIGLSARQGERATAGRVAGGVAAGAGGVVLIGAVLIALVFAVIFLFQTTITGIASAIADSACHGG